MVDVLWLKMIRLARAPGHDLCNMGTFCHTPCSNLLQVCTSFHPLPYFFSRVTLVLVPGGCKFIKENQQSSLLLYCSVATDSSIVLRENLGRARTTPNSSADLDLPHDGSESRFLAEHSTHHTAA